MVETAKVLLVRAPYRSLTFTPAQAAKAEPKLRDAVRALDTEEEYESQIEEGYHIVHVEDTVTDPEGRCSICSTILGNGFRTYISQERQSMDILNDICRDCTEELADELEEYYEENADGALGETL